MNNIVIAGRLTKDPEMSTSKNANEIAKFTVAEDYGFGENKKTNFWDCAVFGKQAAFVGSYCKKGSAVLLTGRVEITKKDDGKKFIDVTVNNIEFQQGNGKPEQQQASMPGIVKATTELVDGESLPF